MLIDNDHRCTDAALRQLTYRVLLSRKRYYELTCSGIFTPSSRRDWSLFIINRWILRSAMDSKSGRLINSRINTFKSAVTIDKVGGLLLNSILTIRRKSLSGGNLEGSLALRCTRGAQVNSPHDQ